MNSAAESNNSSANGLVAQPIPAAIPVEVTGSRIGESSGQREMFTEGTETVLLLPNGAVIRLAAAPTPGQLLFLKNKDTSREVVARLVKYKKSHSGGYAELDFTEPVPGFWGEHFKAEAARSKFPTSAAGFRAASSPQGEPSPASATSQSADSSAHDGSQNEFVPPKAPKSSILTIEEAGKELLDQPAPVAPSADERNAEIAFLQQQLNALLAAGPAPAAAASPAGAPASPPDNSAVAGALLKMLGTATGTATGTPTTDMTTLKLPTPPASAATVPAGSVANALFSGATSPTKPSTLNSEQAVEELLNDSPSASMGEEAFPLPHYHVPPRSSGGLSKILIASALVLGIAAAASIYWYFHRARVAAAAQMSVEAHSAALAVKNAPKPAAKKSDDMTQPAPALEEPKKDIVDTHSAAANDKPSESPTTQAENEKAEAPNEPKEVKVKSVEHAPRPVATKNNHSADHSADADSSDIEPAKVLKTVRAMAPAEATREYVSGNVLIEAVVDETGRVTAMKVLSGPEVLRKTAMDALKKWEYQPAMRNGKPVTSHVTAKIQFWYEP